jgi:hypothetical protein
MHDRDYYKTHWSDAEIVQALAEAHLDEDQLQPPNLRAFFANLPTPERQRLSKLAQQQ